MFILDYLLNSSCISSSTRCTHIKLLNSIVACKRDSQQHFKLNQACVHGFNTVLNFADFSATLHLIDRSNISISVKAVLDDL